MSSATTSRPRRAATRRPAIESHSDEENDATQEASSIAKKPPRKVTAKKPAKRELVDAADDEQVVAAKIPKQSKRKIQIPESDDGRKPLVAKRAKIEIDSATAKPHETQRQQQRTSKRFDIPTKTWTEPELLAQLQQLDYSTAKNIIQLFEDDNTIPFICRYRKETIGDLSPDQLVKKGFARYNHTNS